MAITRDPIFLAFTGATSSAPFGLNVPSSQGASPCTVPVFVDIDGDGDLDAFVGETFGNTLFFRNEGNASSAAFAAPSTNPFNLTDVGFYASPEFVDIDGDGDLDAFIVGDAGDFWFFRNNGSRTNPVFSAASTNNPFGLVKETSNNYSNNYYPKFVDIDSDGDLDVMAGKLDGTIVFFRNNGTASSAAFAAASTAPFGLGAEVGSAAKPTFADMDGDGDLDALVGYRHGNLLFFRNTGSASSAAFAQAVTNPFGLGDIGDRASPTLVDIDGDGDLDALVGTQVDIRFFERITPKPVITATGTGTAVTEGGTTDTYTVVLNYAPTATVTVTLDNTNRQITLDKTTLTFTSSNWNTPQTVTITAVNDTVNEGKHTGVVKHTVTSSDSNYNNLAVKPLIVTITDNDAATWRPYFVSSTSSAPFGLGNAGTLSNPALVDIDGDGDLDAFVGNSNGFIQLFRNTGNASSAAFAAASANPFGLTKEGTYATPTLVDIDGDGDLDAFVGKASGDTLFFHNTGNASSAAFAAATTNPWGLSDVGDLARPTFVDIDGDGDLDAFVGNQSGNTLFFRNDGNASSAVFAAPSINPFGLVGVGANSIPILVDIDGDGDLDAFVGNGEGNTLFFANTGNASSPAFAVASTNPWGLSDVGTFANPVLADIDSDGDIDAFIGNYSGVFTFFQNIGPGITITQSSGSTRVTEGGATDTYTVVLKSAPIADVTVTLDDTNGQVTLDKTTLTFTSVNWNVAQTVTVTARNDTVGEGTHTGVIGHTVASTDTNYNNLAVKPLQVAITDNDLPTHRPFFVLHTGVTSSAPFGLANVGGAVKPVLVDIDGDGDLDAFVGNGEGNTLFLKNNGTASSAAFAVASTNPFGLADVGSVAKPAFVDIDGDGDLDAFVGNWDGDTRFFRNTGNATTAAFAAASINPFGLGNVGYGADLTLVDIDGDGDLDALVGNGAGDIRLFANTGNASSAAFAAASTNPFGLVNVGGRASVTVADVDADGDLDILVGNSNGDMLLFANTGAATLPAFAAAITNPLGLAHVDSNASPALADIDADGDLDVLVGNSAGAIQFFEGVAPKVIITPSGDGTRVSEGGATGDTYTVKLLTKPSADVVVTLDDTNGQIKLDKTTLTFTTSNWNVAQTVTVTVVDDTVNEGAHTGAILHHISSVNDPDYQNLDPVALWVGVADNDAVSSRDIIFTPMNSTAPFGLQDVGEFASPTFADIDADGDLDAFIGNDAGQTLFFLNTGNASSAAFAAAQTNAFGLEDVSDVASPVLVDIDGDGDLDAFIGQGVGTGGGKLLFQENTGNASSAAFAAASSGAFGLVDEGNSVSPVFADIDGDGDLDLFTGTADGTILYYANTGDVHNAAFAAASANPFGWGDMGSNATLALADVDSDGDLDALVGNELGQWLYFANTGEITSPAFAAASTNPFGFSDVGTYTRPALVDIDADGDFDAFAGNADGLTRFLLGGNRLPTGQVKVLGTYQTGAYNWQAFANLQDEDGLGTFSYQWFINGVAVTGATGRSFGVVNAEQARQDISVRVSYTDGFGTKESVTSSATDLQLRGPLTGGNGHDLLAGTTGADVLAGQAGNDWYWVNHSGDTVRESLNAGRDMVVSLLANYTLGNNVEDGRIALSTGASLLGNALGNSLSGGAGDDVLRGLGGADSLRGGLGADTFVLMQAQDTGLNARDTILDFNAEQGDRIDLSAVDANTGTVGNQAFDASILTTGTAFTAAGQLRLEVAGANAVLYGNTDGDAEAEFAVVLMGISAMTVDCLVL